MQIQDDRTPEQKRTHKFLVIGADTFLSGWGKASGGKSYAVWACASEEDFHKVRTWVENRSDMNRVRTTYGTYRPSGRGHCHVYVVNSDHPALSE